MNETLKPSRLWPEFGPTEPKKVGLYLSDTHVHVGGTTNSYRYIPIRQKNQRDYTFERRKAVEVLVAHKGERIAAKDLWCKIHEDGRDFEPQTMERVYRWISSIADDDQFIFRVNRVDADKRREKLKTGEIESYTSSAFDLSIHELTAPRETSMQQLGELAVQPIQELSLQS